VKLSTLNHSRWTLLAPLGLIVLASFSGNIVRAFCLIGAVGIGIWIVHDTEFAKGTEIAWHSRQKHFSRTAIASLVLIIVAVGIFWVSNRIEAFAQNWGKGDTKKTGGATQSAPVPPQPSSTDNQAAKQDSTKTGTPTKKPAQQAAIREALPHSGIVTGKDSTVYGQVPPGSKIGDGSTVVGATDSDGNTILNRGGLAIGNGAKADPTSIAIGAHANAGTAPTPPPSMSQECAPGASCGQSIGQTGGITAGTINLGPPPLLINKEQRDHLTASVKPFVQQFAGKKINISLHNANPETGEFGTRLDTAFKAAGFQTNTGSVTFIGAVLSRGVTIRYGVNRTKLAEAVRDSFLRDKVVDKVYGAPGLDDDDFLIIVAP
jgi:hypothetical protein